MLNELLDKQRRCTDYFFENINLHQIEQLISSLLQRNGIIFFSGIGKSGLVAKKIAFTMVSTGTRAFYLSPIDAVHGDLGMVSPGDTFIILSKSGESDELINIIPAILNKGATLVGVVCNPGSRLAQSCHSSITLPFQEELCPYDMAPTTSTTSQLLFGDLLTIALMRHKEFSLSDYALNHPSGTLGKRITVKVKDVMLTGNRIPTCKAEDKLRDILVELSNKRCGCILIIDDDQRLLGIFMDGDLRRALQTVGGQVLDLKMKDIMNPNPRTINSDVLAWDAMKEMESNPEKRIMVLPVIDSNSRVCGLIHLHDILQRGL